MPWKGHNYPGQTGSEEKTNLDENAAGSLDTIIISHAMDIVGVQIVQVQDLFILKHFLKKNKLKRMMNDKEYILDAES